MATQKVKEVLVKPLCSSNLLVSTDKETYIIGTGNNDVRNYTKKYYNNGTKIPEVELLLFLDRDLASKFGFKSMQNKSSYNLDDLIKIVTKIAAAQKASLDNRFQDGMSGFCHSR